MSVFNSIGVWMMQQRMSQIEYFMEHPYDVQEGWLKKLTWMARRTEFGRRFDFKTITDTDIFRKRIPVQDYESIKNYIIRLRQGEQNILWPSDIKWFAKSSGTSSDKSKFIPVSEESLEECHYKGGKDTLSIYCSNYPDTKLFTGKTLSLGGSQKINAFNSDSYYGDLSAILMKNLPFWAEFIRTPELPIALMEDWEEKLEKMTESTINENVISIAGVPSWFVVLLKYILQKTGEKDLHAIWPNLEVFVHGGVSFTPYREQFASFFPSKNINYLETYNASEGFFGIQDRKDADDMLLMLDYGIYYEFMPMSEIEKEHPKTLTLDEVECGKNYALIISTNGGLWRYMIGDTIEFTSLKPFRIKITGRTKHFINAFGEEVIIDNAEKALDSACKATNAIIKDYTAAPKYMSTNSTGTHEWVIEFEKEPIDFELFKKTLDTTLQSINSDYEAKRSYGLSLKEPIIHNAPQKTFYNWMKQRKKLGGQNKVPRLSNNRKYIDELLTLIKR